MAAKILILEPNRRLANRLVVLLKEAFGDYMPSVVANVKEACMLLIHKPHALALIPVEDGDKIVRALRALQPDLRVVLLAPEADTPVPKHFSGLVQGVLIQTLAEVDMRPVLEKAFAEPMVVESETPQTAAKASQTGPLFGAALADVALGDVVKTAVVSRGPALMTFAGELNEMQAAMVAQRVGRDWRVGGPKTARLQFAQLPAWSGDLLLYTCLVADHYLLTLAAAPDASLVRLRQNGQRLADVLVRMLAEKKADESLAHREDVVAYGRTTYVIVWQPLEPLPGGLWIPLRRAITRLADENDCGILSIDIEAELIHLVVSCPPGRDSVWAAYLFKNGAESIIQQQYKVNARLWETGFYAVESSTPLSPVELSIFLERD